jgi:hypothetical protein
MDSSLLWINGFIVGFTVGISGTALLWLCISSTKVEVKSCESNKSKVDCGKTGEVQKDLGAQETLPERDCAHTDTVRRTENSDASEDLNPI